MRTPFAPFGDPSSYSRLLQPTLIFAGPREAEGARKLRSAMGHRATYIEGRGDDASMYTRQLAEKAMAHFVNSKFRGHLEGFGHSQKLPYLNRLAGGIKAWEKEVAEPPPEDAQGAGKMSESQKLYAAARAAAKLGLVAGH